jgi:serine protease AprX
VDLSASPLTLRWATFRHRIVAVIVALVMVLSAAGSADTAAAVDPYRAAASAVRVVVQRLNPLDRTPERAVERLGGEVEVQLPIVDGFAATVPADQLAALRAAPGVAEVTVDRPVHVQGQYGEGSGEASAVYTDVVRASDVWGQGLTGQGVGVALIDTGVNATGDLAGKVAFALDLTPEQNNVDRYGHGTFVAGLIAGQGGASNGAVKGAAPGAHLVSIKIAGADGTTNLVRLLVALDFVANFKDRLGIRVLNLSLAIDSALGYGSDPVNVAVERVWNSGVVVVVAAGNQGTAPGSISKPGDDPYVITVGASDDRTTVGLSDDTLGTFSGVGPTVDGTAKPDLVAPGKSVVSTRAPGSTIDSASPVAQIGTAYFRGTGTSFSSAVTSGAAALVLSRDQSLNPNQVKQRLVATARPTDRLVPVAARGAGTVDAFAATMSNDRAEANRGVVPARYRGVSGTDPYAAGSSWQGSSWLGSSWQGSSWQGSSWLGSSWLVSSWLGSSWQGSAWLGSTWLADTWAVTGSG